MILRSLPALILVLASCKQSPEVVPVPCGVMHISWREWVDKAPYPAETKWCLSPPNTGWDVTRVFDLVVIRIPHEADDVSMAPDLARETTEPRTHRLSDGWIVAVNHGEFGGDTFVIHSDGRARTHLGDGNVNAIIDVDGDTWLIEGLGHLTRDAGVIRRLERTPTGDSLQTVATMPSAAYVAVADGASALVVTSQALLRVTRAGKIFIVHAGGDRWPGDRSTSIATDAAHRVFIGSHELIMKLTPSATGYDEALLIPEHECHDAADRSN